MFNWTVKSTEHFYPYSTKTKKSKRYLADISARKENYKVILAYVN